MSELALKLIKEAKEKRLIRLDLGNCGLTELPDELFELTHIEILMLCYEAPFRGFVEDKNIFFLSKNNFKPNNIKYISPEIGNLRNLKTLYINGHIGSNHWDLEDLSSLKDLNSLERLSVDHTQVSDLTPLKGLKNLQKLYICSTQVSDLEPLKELSNLKTLFIAQSQVSDLRPITNLYSLKHLNISSTKIKDLHSLKNLSNLEHVDVLACPITNPPYVIAEKGVNAIQRFLKEQNTKETITNNQTKLIFVGNSRAGKTSLWQFLKDKIYNEQAYSTHGIKTEIWDKETLGIEEKQNLAAHIWDFGGQEYYHATHRLFLADNAVYVLVWEKDSNKQGTRLEKFKLDDDPNGEMEEVELEHFPASYWLENIAYFAGKHCPVLIVQNKVDEEALKANYTEGVSEMSDCFHLSVQNAFGFQQGNLTLKRHDLKFQDFKERLLELLRKNATAFKLVKYYAQVREALEAKAKDTEYIAVSELKDIALQFDETPDLENLLAYLKSFTNTVLYFPQNELLKDRLYLNPTHISRDIYKILNKTVRENNGKFDVAHIQTRLNCDVSETERFVALMKEFDLVFEKEEADKGQVFIAPQYLKEKDKLGINIDAISKQLKLKPAFYLRFASFVPRSMMSRFIAHNGQFTTDETYWKNGLIYSSKETDASIKVEYTHEARTFCIDVQNPDEQAVDMQNIVAQFVKLNNSDDKIEISNDGNAYFELRKIYMAYDQNRKEIDNNEGQYTPLPNFDWLFEKHKTEEPMAFEFLKKILGKATLKERVCTLISEAKTKEAMDEIAAWAHEQNQEQLKSDISLLKGDWADLSREKTLGLLSNSDASLRQNQLNNKVLSLVNAIENIDNELIEKTNNAIQELDCEVEILKYLLSNNDWKGSISGFASTNNVNMKYVAEVVERLKNRGLIKELMTLPKEDALIKATFSAEKFLENNDTLEIQKAKKLSTIKPKIYFSYAWGDDHETGESREKLIGDLYESLKNDGFNVFRDKEDAGYKDLISDMMKDIGRGEFIVVAISDKYLKSPNCMFEMYEIYRNSKLEKDKFIEKIYPIRVESIRLSDPKVLDTYFDHWEQQEKEWADLITKRGTRISPAQQERYKRIKAIASELGEFLELLSDINSKTKEDLSQNNFEAIKKAIKERIES